MGKYEKLVSEDLNNLNNLSFNTIKDKAKPEKEESQNTIDILSDSSCQVNYRDSVQNIKEKNTLKETLPLIASNFLILLPRKHIV